MTQSLLFALLMAGAYQEAQDILCANFPDKAPYIRQIAPPTVGFKSRSWIDWRHLVWARGHTKLFASPNVKVSLAGGFKKVYYRLRHEFFHWIIFNTTITEKAHDWVDHYWRHGT